MAFNFKKALAFTLAAAMIVTAAPAASINTEAAAKKPTITASKTINADKTASIKVTTQKKNRYIKITSITKAANVTIKAKISGKTKTLKKNKYYKVTGKSVTLKVTGKDAVANYTSTIKVSVFDKSGKKYKVVKPKNLTAKVKVKATQLAIESVVSTTADGGQGYKYIRASFNKALSSLNASEVEISDASTGKIYSVDSVKLASSGKTADITLTGDASVAGTRFLDGNTDYIFKVTQGGVTANITFNIPEIGAELVVVGFDKDKRTIKVTGGTGIGTTTFTDSNKLISDFNELLGRTVTFEYDKNYVLTKVNTLNEKVIYSAFESIKGDTNDETNTYYAKAAEDAVKDNVTGIKDKVTETEYDINRRGSYQAGSSVYVSTEIIYNDGVSVTDSLIEDVNANTAKNEVVYAKVVLNANGTVRSIVSIKEWSAPSSIYVKSVNENYILDSDNNSQTLKDYVILKEGKTVAVSDIKAGDVVFFNTVRKVAEVYNNSVEGTLTAYDNNFKVGSNKYDYQALTGKIVVGTKVDDLTNDNVKKYDGNTVKLFLNRAGDAAQLVATAENVTTTEGFEIVTSDAKAGTNGSDYVISFKTTGGEYSNINGSTLQYVVGANGKKVDRTDSTSSKKYFEVNAAGDIELDLNDDGDTADAGETDIVTIADLTVGDLVKVVKRTDGSLYAIELADSDFAAADLTLASNGDVSSFGDTNAANTVTKDGKKITVGLASYALTSSTPMIIYDESDKTASVKTYGDCDFTFVTDTLANGVLTNKGNGVIRTDGKDVKCIVIYGDSSDISSALDVDKTLEGIITDYGKKDNKFTELKMIVGTEEITYTEDKFANDCSAAGFKEGYVVRVDISKDGKVLAVKDALTEEGMYSGSVDSVVSGTKKVVRDVKLTSSVTPTIAIIKGNDIDIKQLTDIDDLDSAEYTLFFSLYEGQSAYADTVFAVEKGTIGKVADDVITKYTTTGTLSMITFTNTAVKTVKSGVTFEISADDTGDIYYAYDNGVVVVNPVTPGALTWTSGDANIIDATADPVLVGVTTGTTTVVGKVPATNTGAAINVTVVE